MMRRRFQEINVKSWGGSVSESAYFADLAVICVEVNKCRRAVIRVVCGKMS
jgi:hypothetical protein